MKRGRNQRRRQGMNINRALDSNGPDVRIRGTANQIYDKYLALARDASSSGDRVKAENYLQHAEHYFRLIRSLQPAQPVQSDSLDADGDQPSIGETEERQRRRDNENGDNETSGGGNGRETPSASPEPESRANGAADAEEGDNDGDQRRPPRRRRQRKPQRDDDSASADSDADKKAEITAS